MPRSSPRMATTPPPSVRLAADAQNSSMLSPSAERSSTIGSGRPPDCHAICDEQQRHAVRCQWSNLKTEVPPVTPSQAHAVHCCMASCAPRSSARNMERNAFATPPSLASIPRVSLFDHASTSVTSCSCAGAVPDVTGRIRRARDVSSGLETRRRPLASREWSKSRAAAHRRSRTRAPEITTCLLALSKHSAT